MAISSQIITPTGGGIALIVLCAIFIPAIVVAIVLRLYARHLSRRKLQINDWLAIVAAVLSIVYAITTMLAVLYGGVGYHLIDVLPSATILAQYVFALGILWGFANTAVKLSILHLYVSIFSTSKAFRYIAYGLMGLSIAYCIMSFLQFIFLCQPIAFNWDPTIPGGHCADFSKIALSAGIINLLIDVAIVTMPMPVLWRLQMKTSRKISISVIFGVGFLICVLSIVRIVSISSLNLMDISYSVVNDAIFTLLEPCLGTINCCLPVLQPVAAQVSNFSVISRISTTFSRTGRTSTANSSKFSSSNRHKLSSNPQLGEGSDTILTEIEVRPPKSAGSEDMSSSHRTENAIQVSHGWSVKSS